MPMLVENVQNRQEPPPLILKLDESELSEQMEMERLLVLIRNSDCLDPSVRVALDSPLSRRRFEEVNHLPKGGMDYIAFLNTPEYVKRVYDIIDVYNKEGGGRSDPNSVLDLVVESGSRYDELVPFLVRTKIDFFSIQSSTRESKGTPSFRKEKEVFTAVFPIAPLVVVALNAVIAVNAAGFTSAVFSVKLATVAVAATSLGFWVSGE